MSEPSVPTIDKTTHNYATRAGALKKAIIKAAGDAAEPFMNASKNVVASYYAIKGNRNTPIVDSDFHGKKTTGGWILDGRKDLSFAALKSSPQVKEWLDKFPWGTVFRAKVGEKEFLIAKTDTGDGAKVPDPQNNKILVGVGIDLNGAAAREAGLLDANYKQINGHTHVQIKPDWKATAEINQKALNLSSEIIAAFDNSASPSKLHTPAVAASGQEVATR
jgi:hypothetical protein